MSKKITLIVVLLAISILAFVTSLFNSQIVDLQNKNRELQAQNTNFQNQTIALQDQNRRLEDRITQLLEQLGENSSSLVKIVAFKWIGGFHPIVGLLLEYPVNVTIQNKGAIAVSGLSLTVRLINKYDGTQIGESGGTNTDPLQSGETREIKAAVYAALDTSFDDAACVITLRSGNSVLDEWTRSIS